jgi:hypothetical protein
LAGGSAAAAQLAANAPTTIKANAVNIKRVLDIHILPKKMDWAIA